MNKYEWNSSEEPSLYNCKLYKEPKINTKCINSLIYFINESIENNWCLDYPTLSDDMLDIMGFIERTKDGYVFVSLLYNEYPITECK